MSERPDSDTVTVSMQFKIAGRRALIQNSMIGAAVAVVFASTVGLSGFMSPIGGFLLPVIGGTIMGGVGAFIAWIGQVAAQHEQQARNSASGEYRQPINGAAVLYSGWVMAWFSSIVISLINLVSAHSESGLLITGMALIFGAMLAAALTIITATILRTIRSSLSRAKQAQMLGQGQFDPLHHTESVREQVRR